MSTPIRFQPYPTLSDVPVSYADPLPVQVTSSVATTVSFAPASGDAFGRLRVSTPTTLFDSKQIHDNLPLYYDDQQTSGGGTTSSYASATASTTIGVALNTAGTRVRQTFQRFNYQPGKSLLCLLTGVLRKTGGGTGVTSSMGYYDQSNGVFVRVSAGTLQMVIRSSTSGSPVDNAINQSSWNGDKLDGTGASGITIDPTKSQIFWTDLEWLGVGSVRCGFVINREFIICHTFNHANTLSVVYMSTPNLPIRYEISNAGTGVASTMEHICSTVISEGGADPSGALRYISTAGVPVSASASGTNYAAFGIA